MCSRQRALAAHAPARRAGLGNRSAIYGQGG
jgi:hypothetical protein